MNRLRNRKISAMMVIAMVLSVSAGMVPLFSPVVTLAGTLENVALRSTTIASAEMTYDSATYTDASLAPTTKSLVNVALFKPVTASCWETPHPKNHVNNEDGTKYWSTIASGSTTNTDLPGGTWTYGSSGTNWIQVDLLKRYKIEKIELWDRQFDQPENRRNFSVRGSNDPTFATYTTLASIGSSNNNTLWPPLGVYTIDLSSTKPAFRYIRFQKTNFAYTCLDSLKVFASCTATEVSRNASATAGTEHSSGQYPASKAVDGLNSSPDDCWVYDYTNNNYDFLRLDLGDPRHIGLIEIEGRQINPDEESARNNFNIYGSNAVTISDAVNLATPNLDAVSGYTQLTSLANPGTINSYSPFPPIYSTTQTRPYYQASVNDIDAYQYITFKKTAKTAAIIGEMRLYEINPEVNSSSFNEGTVTVNFSDVMDANTLTASNVTVTKNGSTPVTYTDASLSEDGYTYTLNIPNFEAGTYTVSLNTSVTNTYGIPLVSYSADFITQGPTPTPTPTPQPTPPPITITVEQSNQTVATSTFRISGTTGGARQAWR